MKLIAPKYAVNDGNPKNKFHLIHPYKEAEQQSVCGMIDCQFLQGTPEHKHMDCGYTNQWHVKKRISQLKPEQICQKCLGPLRIKEEI